MKFGMDFTRARKWLIETFISHNFAALYKSGKTKTIWVENTPSGSGIAIAFPGYKTRVAKNGSFYYDYRVVLHKNNCDITLSHVNLIIDIYNKLTRIEMDEELFYQWFIRFIADDHFSLHEAVTSLKFNDLPLCMPDFDKIDKYHQQLNKKYNRAGNRYNLTIDELFIAMKWIVVQEDINYPIEQGFLGRKMAFARYLEVFHCKNCQTHTVKQVVERALTHSRPRNWPDMDYSALENI
jgi:hypothetical protein